MPRFCCCPDMCAVALGMWRDLFHGYWLLYLRLTTTLLWLGIYSHAHMAVGVGVVHVVSHGECLVWAV